MTTRSSPTASTPVVDRSTWIVVDDTDRRDAELDWAFEANAPTDDGVRWTVATTELPPAPGDHDASTAGESSNPTPLAGGVLDASRPSPSEVPVVARAQRTGRRRRLVALGSISVAAAMAAGAVAMLLERAPVPSVVLEAEDVVADSPPATLPPRPVVSGAAEPGVAPGADDLGARTSALPEMRPVRPNPTSISIGGIELDASVRPVGLDERGGLEIPDGSEVGWYRHGSSPGRPGASVLAAHVSWNRSAGPFAQLGRLEPGDRIEVSLDDGHVRAYEVVERRTYDKDELPRDRIWRTSGDEELVLITCGGDFNPDVRRYRHNIVVYAVPVG